MQKIIFINVILILLTSYLSANEIKSDAKERCNIEIIMGKESVSQKVSCQTGESYPSPEIGYDNENCIRYRVSNFKNSFNEPHGLYCSIDQLDPNSYWYHVF